MIDIEKLLKVCAEKQWSLDNTSACRTEPLRYINAFEDYDDFVTPVIVNSLITERKATRRVLGAAAVQLANSGACPSQEEDWTPPEQCSSCNGGCECECWELYFKDQIEKEQP